MDLAVLVDYKVKIKESEKVTRPCQEMYNIWIGTSSRRVKWDEKTYLWRGLTTKRNTYCPTKWDNRLSKGVQDIQRSHKVYQENREKLESETDSKRKKLAEVKILRNIFQWDALSLLLLFVITISHSITYLKMHYRQNLQNHNKRFPTKYI